MFSISFNSIQNMWRINIKFQVANILGAGALDIYELAFLPLNYKYGIVIYTMPCARISKDIIDYRIFSSIFFSKCDVSLPGLDFNVIRLHDTGSEGLAGGPPASPSSKFESRPFLQWWFKFRVYSSETFYSRCRERFQIIVNNNICSGNHIIVEFNYSALKINACGRPILIDLNRGATIDNEC